jgi:signal transduction histidine kinase
MNKVFTILLVFFMNPLLFADENHRNDSIRTKISDLENQLYNSINLDLSTLQKIGICNELADLYADSSYEKQIEFGARALVLAEEIGNEQQITYSLNILGNAYHKLDKYEKAIEYATRLYSIYNTNNNEIDAAKALSLIGSCYYDWSKYFEAKEYYERALDIYKKNQYFEGIALSLRDLSKILASWGEYDEALTYHQESLKFWEEIGDENGVANSYNNIGIIYQELGNYDRAFDFFQKSLVIFKKLNSAADIVNLTLHIGDIYLQRKQYDKALEFYSDAELIGKPINNKKLNAITLSNIGEAYNLKGEYLKALDYQKKALVLKEQIGDKRRLSITYTELGVIYKNVEDFTQALQYLSKGLALATEINFKFQMIKCYLALSEVYDCLNNPQKSLEYYKLHIDGKEKIYSEESKQTIAELQARFQSEKKDKENERLRHIEQLNKVQIRNQQLIIGFALFILIGSFAILVIFHKRYQQNQKLNIQLSLKNKEVEQQQVNEEKLNKKLKDANETKDKFFSIVAHDLKSPFNSLLVLTNLLIDDYDTFTEEERKQFIRQIKASSENTFSLLQNLLDWASTQLGKTMVVPENIDVSKILQETIALLTPTAKNKRIRIVSNIPENTFAWADKNMVSAVVLNLVSNAIKFTPLEGQVEVKSNMSNNHLEIAVEDNGVGISPRNLEKLFLLDQKIQTVGTAKETGTGLGLIICKEFVEKNNGKIWVTSKLGEGSRFYFTLPRPTN